ncbi:amidohydrolase [Foetidibacter luteolus]|uniref:amidohydrolase n=1 Tax=Foetidibacter luteolus TaxID=2608880 RepID=UPI00129A2E33|nr:amidohydrolase [Foetidibacter luteolus]
MKFYLATICLLALCLHTAAQDSLNSDEKILFNARIFTANAQMPFAEAVAIKGNKIMAVGNLYEVSKAVSSAAVKINLDGGCVLPGFIDSHNHAVDGGESLSRPNVSDTLLTPGQLAEYAKQVIKSGEGMTGNFLVIYGMNISSWSDIGGLSRVFNAPEFENQPVLLVGSDWHTEWANLPVLKAAGINKEYIAGLSEDKRKYFGYNSSFEPNGFVADSGFEKIDAVLPTGTSDYKKAGLKAMEYNNALGITAWLDPAAGNVKNKEFHILDTYAWLAKEQKLSAHVAAAVVADGNGDAPAQVKVLRRLQAKYNTNANLNVCGFKIFADGVIEHPTQTAALSQPYINSGSKGVLMFNPAKFARFATNADKEKLLVHVHAIGDRAVTETLNGFEAARKANGFSGIPHTITHIQVAKPADFARFAQLKVLASLQLLWALGDVTTIDIVKPYIAPELYRYQYPARSLLQAGTTICGASDWPVSTANPFEAMYEAETRKGKMGVLDSTQCMPRLAMLYAYTSNAAKALMLDKKTGSIVPGKYADMILVDRDVLTISPEAFRDTKVSWTMFEGKIVYKNNEAVK